MRLFDADLDLGEREAIELTPTRVLPHAAGHPHPVRGERSGPARARRPGQRRWPDRDHQLNPPGRPRGDPHGAAAAGAELHRVDATASAPVRARASSGPSVTPTPPTVLVGRRHRELAEPHRPRRHPRPRRLLHPRLRRATSAPRSWVATSSARSAARGRTTTGRAGGATSRRSTPRCSCSPTTCARRSPCPTPRSTSSTPRRPRPCAQAKEAADGKDVRLGGGVATVREFLDADLVDTMHIAVAPVELGRGERLWESPDELLDRFHLDVGAQPQRRDPPPVLATMTRALTTPPPRSWTVSVTPERKLSKICAFSEAGQHQQPVAVGVGDPADRSPQGWSTGSSVTVAPPVRSAPTAASQSSA